MLYATRADQPNILEQSSGCSDGMTQLTFEPDHNGWHASSAAVYLCYTVNATEQSHVSYAAMFKTQLMNTQSERV